MSLRVSMSRPLSLGLFRTHVGRRADELLKGGEERLVRQTLALVALAMPKSMILGIGAPSCDGHEDVRGLEVAMDDALLVGVLDGLANLDEQVEPLLVVEIVLRRSNR